MSSSPELKLNLNIYGKSSAYFNGSSELIDYTNIYKQLILKEKSSPLDADNVENGKFQFLLTQIINFHVF